MVILNSVCIVNIHCWIGGHKEESAARLIVIIYGSSAHFITAIRRWGPVHKYVLKKGSGRKERIGKQTSTYFPTSSARRPI